MRRRPPLHAVGTDPDYRFTLANERTFLAWLRTGLALVAGAVALASLVPDLKPRALRIGLTDLLLVLATVVTAGAYVRWERAERALRMNRPLPMGLLPRLVVSGLVIVILGVAVLVILAEIGTR
jgi:putative membrane protein